MLIHADFIAIHYFDFCCFILGSQLQAGSRLFDEAQRSQHNASVEWSEIGDPSGSSSAAVGANKEAVNAKDSEADIHKEADVAAMTPANDAQDTAVVVAKLVGPLGFLKKGFLKQGF